MIETLKKLWHDPVWSKVIAAAVIASATYFLVDKHIIWKILESIFEFMIFQVSMPIWVLILSSLVFLFLIPIIAFIKKRKIPRFLSYKSDNIFDIDWFWEWSPPSVYNNNKYEIMNITPRCPSCYSLLDLNDYSGILVNCVNENCNWEWEWARNRSSSKHITHSSELKSKVLNEIDRRVYAGEKGIS